MSGKKKKKTPSHWVLGDQELQLSCGLVKKTAEKVGGMKKTCLGDLEMFEA